MKKLDTELYFFGPNSYNKTWILHLTFNGCFIVSPIASRVYTCFYKHKCLLSVSHVDAKFVELILLPLRGSICFCDLNLPRVAVKLLPKIPD